MEASPKPPAAGRRARFFPLVAAAPWAAPAFASLAIMAAQAFRFPSALRDAATGQFVADARLHVPAGHLLLTPFSSLADLLTFNSVRQHQAWLAWILLGYWAAAAFSRVLGRTFEPRRAILGYAWYLLLVSGFLAWGALTPRAMTQLWLSEPGSRRHDTGRILLDFHSHTSASHDGRGSFDPAQNMRWHRAAGFHAGFITDHNTRAASDMPPALQGVEVSLRDAHVVALGPGPEIDRAPYDGSAEGVLRFLKDARKRMGLVTVMSLPEYWSKQPPERWEEYADAGAHGFELVNAAPKALDFPEAGLRRVVELCRRRNLFVAGASDVHGWGRAALVWNVMPLPGHNFMDHPRLQEAVLKRLRDGGFGAVQVIERVRKRPGRGAWVALDPPLSVWAMLRTFTWAQAAACLAWVWVAALRLMSRIRGRQ